MPASLSDPPVVWVRSTSATVASARSRRFAASFYYKPSRITGVVQDWIDNGKCEPGDIDDDAIELAEAVEREFVRGKP